MIDLLEGRIVTIPNISLDTVVAHSVTAVKVTHESNNGSMKGYDKSGHLHWFTRWDVRKVKEV